MNVAAKTLSRKKPPSSGPCVAAGGPEVGRIRQEMPVKPSDWQGLGHHQQVYAHKIQGELRTHHHTQVYSTTIIVVACMRVKRNPRRWRTWS